MQYRFQRHEYFPFGLGDRSCIAREFAMVKFTLFFYIILHSLELLQIEVKVILALLLKTFKFTLEEGYEFVRDTSIMLYPKNGVPCTLTLRENREMTIKENNPKRTFSVC